MKAWTWPTLAVAAFSLSIGAARANVIYEFEYDKLGNMLDLTISLPGFITAMSSFPVSDFTVVETPPGFGTTGVTFIPDVTLGDTVVVSFNDGSEFNPTFPPGSFLNDGTYIESPMGGGQFTLTVSGTPAPEPGSLPLLGSAMLLLASFTRLYRRRTSP
jgi:hypothetical protein